MTLPVALRIARRELRGGLSGFWIFLLCLTLGVGAIAAVGSVRAAITEGMQREGATLLGGDAELQFTFRFARDDERAWMAEEAAQVSQVVDFRSMAVVGQGETTERALTQVKGVDDNWPLIGEAVFDPPMSVAEVLAERDGLPGAAMDRLIADRLGLELGQRFRLGVQEFVLVAHLLREPDAITTTFAAGPRTLVSTEALAASELLGAGTMYETNYRMMLAEGDTLDRLRVASAQRFEGEGARWRDSRRGAPRVAEFVDRIASFLVLVGLAGLAVGGVGVSAAVRAYLEGKTPVIATLKTLGAEGRTIFAVYFAQIGVLTALGVAAGLLLGISAPILLAPVLEARLPVPAVFTVHPQPLIEAALYGMLTALVFTLWPLARVEQVRAAALFRGVGSEGLGWPRWRYLVALSLTLAALVGTAAGLAAVPRLALAAAAGIVVALGVLLGAALLLRLAARRLAQVRWLRGRTALRLALGAVGNPREGVTAVVLSLGLGLTVLATVGQIDANLRSAIAADLPDRAPSYFFIDIQPDQLEGFLERLRGDPAVSEIATAPQLRGVITAINDIPAREWGDHWVLRGDRGLTYSTAPPEGTVLVEGEWWPADYAGDPLISFGINEGRELGLSLGDRVTVNVLGRSITGSIANFRELDFRTGGIGFVMTFNPAAFAGAPHTHLATVHAAPEAEAAILRDLSNQFPNITAVQVREVAARVAEALGALAGATAVAALATLITGFVVLIGAAAAGERARVFEAAVLKTIGATRATILASFALRSALMGAAAAAVAVVAAVLASWLVLTRVMDVAYVFQPVSALMIIAGGVLATLLAGLAFALRPLASRPARILRAQE
ncbi:FtsX-like permease family protein [Pararhodobacter sp. SW119]|uniref:ABC transporter permease n=1 Tax=Pararhodobacter sp. SW119 TaxID=2780075 RepID=UPI001ADF3334|nr:FtsX-like permease family protein [Pararhodobacter sp. SW119]